MPRELIFPFRAPSAVLLLLIGLAGCGRIDPAAEFEKATVAFESREPSVALIHVSNVLQAVPDHAGARALRGRLALQSGDLERARDDFERAIAHGSSDESLRPLLAEVLVNLGEAGEALRVLDDAPESARDAAYWSIRAEASALAGELGPAQEALERSRALGGETTRLLLTEARIEDLRGTPSNMEELLTRAVDAAANDLEAAEARLLRGFHRLREGAIDLAAEDLEQAADIFAASGAIQQESAALTALVQASLSRNDLEEAGRHARRLAARAPNALSTAYVEALVAYEEGDFNRAIVRLQGAVNAAPDNAMLRTLLGAAHLSRGDVFQAETHFQRVLTLAPNDPAARKLLAETRLRQRRPEAALDALRPLSDLTTDPQVPALQGVASLEAGDAEQAIVFLEQAAAADPSNQAVKVQLARAYLARSRVEDAAELLGQLTFARTEAFQIELAVLLEMFRDGRVDEASRRAEELAAASPASGAKLAAAAVFHHLRGDAGKAMDLLEQAVDAEPSFVPARLFIAALLVDEGRVAEAERRLREVLDIAPGHPVATTALAQALRAQGKLDMAQELLEQTLASEGPQPQLYLALAQLLVEQGDLQRAAEEVDRAAELAPDDPSVTLARGLVASAAGRWNDAVESLSAVSARAPTRADVALALARAQIGAGDLPGARSTLSRFREANASSLPVTAALGVVELRAGNGNEALQIAKSLQVDYPQRAVGYLLEGDVRMAQRRYDGAAGSYRLAFEREPSWTSLSVLVSALRLDGRAEESARVVERWLVERAEDVPARLLLANILEGLGRGQDALAQYERVLTISETNVVALNNAAWLHQELGDARALELARAAYDLAPDNPAILDTLGWILVQRGAHDEALRYLEVAAAASPDAPEIRYHLAHAFAEAGQPEAARGILTALLADFAEFGSREDAEALLARL